ncbi:hypothetical protein J22TS3_21070 [Paenibacillus sp. J22TS3]|nr:hypothetical protein J22TS3_21070 [Paenibacillus sp. J22TS3]
MAIAPKTKKLISSKGSNEVTFVIAGLRKGAIPFWHASTCSLNSGNSDKWSLSKLIRVSSMYHVMERDTNHVFSDLLNYGTKRGESFMEVTAIVIAGGLSSRMGQNKALLPLAGIPLIERLVRSLEQIAPRVVIVANDGAPYSYLHKEVVPDIYSLAGPLAGLHAGLAASGTEWNLVTACDMPFINAAVGQRLIDEAERHSNVSRGQEEELEAVIPLTSSGVLPLLSMYKRTVLASLETALQEKELRLVPWTKSLQAAYIPAQLLCEGTGTDEELLSFNMNRPGDYEEASRRYTSWLGRDFDRH